MKIVIIIIVILLIILFLRKTSGKKGTWDKQQDIEEYAYLVAPKFTNNDVNLQNEKMAINEKDVKEKKDDYSSLGEKICKKHLESKLKKKFVKSRPDFLKNPVTGANLELDCYCPELNLALEYNGKQHYEYIGKFHKYKPNFQNQQYRDRIKIELCYKNGVDLIIVPYYIPHTQIPKYIDKALKKLNLIQ